MPARPARLLALGAVCLASASAFAPAAPQVLPGRKAAAATGAAEADSRTGTAAGNIGWDSHVPIASAPDSLVRGVEGNESMRRRFEAMCRDAQNSICKAIEEAGASLAPIQPRA